MIASILSAPCAARRMLAPGALALMLAACVDGDTNPPSFTAPQGASARQALEGFAITLAVADVIGDNCRDYGIRKNYSSTRSLIRSYTDNLIRQGYSPQELERATQTLSPVAGAGKAVDYVKARGAREGDRASLCRVGQREIASGTSVGRLLRN